MKNIVILFAFVFVTMIASAMIVCLYRSMVDWRETAAKHQDEAAKLKEELDGAQNYAEKLEKRMTFAEDSARKSCRQEADAKYRLRAEQNKCEELRRMLSETRTALDGERESWTELLDREREKNRELYDDLMQERDAYAKLKNEHAKLEADISDERAKLAKEKQILSDMQNIFQYNGTDAGQVNV